MVSKGMAVGRANYLGDVRETVGQVVGPTLAGEYLVVTDAVFDEVAGRSVASFGYASPADLQGPGGLALAMRQGAMVRRG